MTHVATAVINASAKPTSNGTFPVPANKATQLRNQHIAQETPPKRQQSFAIKSRIEIFENKENVQSNGPTAAHPPRWASPKASSQVVIVNGGPNNNNGSAPLRRQLNPAEQTQPQLSKGPSPGSQTQQQRYKNVVVKAPSISIDVAPWTPGAKVVTDSDVEEVQRILAHRRKLIDSSIEAEALGPAKANDTNGFRPLSLDLSDESSRESAGATLDVLFPRAIDLARNNIRLLWRDVRGVVDLGIVDSLEKDGRTKQEAKFELMLSEGSFLHGLNTLKTHYMRNIHKHVPQVVTEKDYDLLFKYVEDVRLCSEAFLEELDGVWQSDPMLNGIYPIITTHTTNHFQAYVRYCRNMVDMSAHLRSLTSSNKLFAELLSLLASREGGQRLTLDAFLTAPMQRITKLPLLLRTIMDKTEADSEEHSLCAKAYEAAAKVAMECDEVVNERKRVEEVLRLSQEIEFADDTKAIPIMAPSRVFVSRAYVKHFAFRDGAPRREKLHLILFNDLLLVTKKKSDMYLVVDWCLRDELCMKEVENGALYGKEDAKQTNPVVFTMLNNSQDKKLDLVVTFKEQALRREWLGMLSEGEHEEAAEEESEQMIALQDHQSTDQSQLVFSPGDVIRVLASPDEAGWCVGELLSDGTRGRFPVEKTTKITSSRIKAANLKAKKEMRSSRNMDDAANTKPDDSITPDADAPLVTS